LKEFEALAREALGSDEGFAPVENGSTDETSLAAPAAEKHDANAAPTDFAAMEAREELLEETAANNEGMAGDKSNELPKAAAAGE
jgi:hypothetical protein